MRKQTTFPFKDETNKLFGKLLVLKRVANKHNGSAHWLCLCACGNEKVVSGSALRAGFTVSCGCVALEKNKRLMAKLQEGNDGRSRHPLFETWRKMIARCEDKKHPAYKNYGGRGIIVCAEWYDFWKFATDVGERPKGLTMERINNNLGYFKTNIKWATYKEQNNNRRPFSYSKGV